MKQKSSWNGIFKRAGIGVAAACGAALLVCCLLGLLVLKELVLIEAAPVVAVIAAGICVFLACYLVARGIPQSRLPVSLGMAAAFSLACLAVKAAALPKMEFLIRWPAAIPFLAAITAGLMSSRKKRHRR